MRHAEFSAQHIADAMARAHRHSAGERTHRQPCAQLAIEPRVEVVPPPPGARYLWEPGHWHWNGVAYAWIPGHYITRRAHYAHYVPGHWHWAPARGGWVWAPAHWG